MRRPPQYERALALLAGPAATGRDFMKVAAEALAIGLGYRCVGIVQRNEDGLGARTLAWYLDGELQPPVEYALAGTPCAHIYEPSPPPWHVAVHEDVQEKFPEDRMLVDLGVVSYRGEGFASGLQHPVGHVFVMDDRPLLENMYELSFFKLVAQRAGAEFNRARAELELRRSEQRLKDFASTAADWLWETDSQGRFTYYSGPEAYYPNFDIIGQTRWEFAGVDPGADATFAAHMDDLRYRRPFRNFSYSIFCGGREVRFSVSGVPVFDDGGNFVGYRGTTRDMSSQWQTRLRLEASTRRLQSFLSVAGRLAASEVVETDGLHAAASELTESVARELAIDRVSLWILEPDGHHLRCLDRFVTATGRHEDGELVPARLARPSHGTTVVAMANVAEDPRAEHLRVSGLMPPEISAIMHADIWREGRYVGSLALSQEGAPRQWTEEEQVFAGFLAQYAARLIEADARLRAERRLAESEAFHRALIENAHDDFSVVGPDGIVRFHSSSAVQRRETGSRDLVGRHIDDVVPEEARASLRSLLSGNTRSFLLRYADEQPRGFELIARDMLANPVVRGIVLTWRDVSERLTNMEALRAAKEEAELANRSKSAFLANISHELRTPLNAVLGFSEIIRDQLLGPIEISNYVEYADDIHESGQHLLNVINEILDLSKIEAGQQDVTEVEVDLRQAVATCFRLVGRNARAANVDLSRCVPDGFPWLLADDRHIKQILLNLLSNAIKFTEAGGTASVSASLDHAGGIALSVADSGIGMSREGLLVALTPFGQVENSYARRFEGTGLGLPLTKALAELNGGRLEIESVPGHGTTVWIKFGPDRTVPPDLDREGRVSGVV